MRIKRRALTRTVTGAHIDYFRYQDAQSKLTERPHRAAML